MRVLWVIYVIIMVEDKNFRHLVRIANTDLDGNKSLLLALQRIKGIGFMFSNALCSVVGIDRFKKTGYLSDTEASKLGEAIANPDKFGIPVWLQNRRKDPETGEDGHLISSDLNFVQENDIKLMRKIKSYKGARHFAGLPLRGQRTKSNFRKNKGKGKGTLGVTRKKK